MDRNQQPPRNRERSRRSRSRLSSALEYVDSRDSFDASIEQSPPKGAVKTDSTRLPERTSADTPLQEGAFADTPTPGRTSQEAVADTMTPGRATSVQNISPDQYDQKKRVFRNSSKPNSQVRDVPKSHKFDFAPGMDNDLSSPEPSLFASANSSFRGTPLPSIRASQDKQLKQRITRGESEKEREYQAYRKKKEEERQRAVKEREDQGLQVVLPHQMKALALKLGKEKGAKLKAGSLIRRDDNLTLERAESKVNRKAALPSQSKQKEQVPLPALKVPKPPSRPMGNIVVRETKASRLRKIRLQMESEKSAETPKVLPPIKTSFKAPVKQRTRTPINETQRQEQEPPSPHNSRSYSERSSSERSSSERSSSERSSSESPPPTPIEPGPPRPAFVPRLDLSGLLSPDDYPNSESNLLAPRDVVVRETKASKLLRLKKQEDEKLAKKRKEEEKVKDLAFKQSKKRSPSTTYKLAPPKPHKKSEPVVIKETKACKLCGLRVMKEEESKDQSQKNKTLEGQQKRLHIETSTNESIELDSSKLRQVQDNEKISNGIKRHERPRTSCPLPPILQNGKENSVKNRRITTPVNGSEISLSNPDYPDEHLSRTVSNELTEELSFHSEKKKIGAKSETICGSDISRITSRHVPSPPTTSKPISRRNRAKAASIEKTTALKHTEAIEQNASKAGSLKLKENTKDKEQEALDETIRNKICRLELILGLKARRQIRMDMENDEQRWKLELMDEFKDIEDPFVFVGPDDDHREFIKRKLDDLKEQLEEMEAEDKKGSKSKVKAFLDNNFGSCFKSKAKIEKERLENENIQKEKEEKIDDYFRTTAHSLNSVLGDIWERFVYQQDDYREMLEKVTLQEEMLYKWKSEAKHYRFMHTMLKRDFLGDCKESWYIQEKDG